MDRVLLGAIFRKLPLKLLLIILAVAAVFVACFSSATEIVDMTTVWQYTRSTSTSYDIMFNWLWDFNSIACITCTNEYTNWQVQIQALLLRFSRVNWICFYLENWTSIYLDWQSQRQCTINISNPNYSSQQCQTEYNLIPINEVDAAYCESNNLCPASGSPSDCPNVWVSNLFINDVFHPGAFNVIMNIPEEIDWDYAYTNSGSNINIDVVWYNQDTEYINWLIDVQNYQPTTDDFTKVFTNFWYFGWLLVACLFVILVFYFIKRLFK